MASVLAKEFSKKDGTKINSLLIDGDFYSLPTEVLLGDDKFLGYINASSVTADVKEITKLDLTGIVAADLDGKYLVIWDEVGEVAFWFDVDNSGTTIPAGASAIDAGVGRALEITTITTGMTVAQQGTAIYNAIVGDSKFEAGSAASTPVITVQSSTNGFKTVGRDGDSGIAIARDTRGTDVASIVVKIQHSPIRDAADADWIDLVSFTAVTADVIETIELNTTTDHVYEFVRVYANWTSGEATITCKLYHDRIAV